MVASNLNLERKKKDFEFQLLLVVAAKMKIEQVKMKNNGWVANNIGRRLSMLSVYIKWVQILLELFWKLYVYII